MEAQILPQPKFNENLGALTARELVLDMKAKIKCQQLAVPGQKSKAWDLLKKKINSAKIEDALTSPKIYVNGHKFTILRPLGEGGYSTVYEVYSRDKKLYALKIVDLAIHADCVKQDLIREIVFLEKLKKCDLVVKAFHYELRKTEDEHKMFVLMEKGDKDFHQILEEHRNRKSLSPAKLRYFWEEMLEAVLELHENNIIHTDLKPGNFLLVGGHLKIIDFGLAMELRAGQDYAYRKFVGGTNKYLSPESLSGGSSFDPSGSKLCTKSDVWALGIVLYQAVYGVLPFSSVPGGRAAKLNATNDPNIPVDFEVSSSIDPHLLDTMKRCLEKNPEKRASIKELLVHPYLRPELGSKIEQVSSTCNVCKKKGRKLAKISSQRNPQTLAQ